MFRCSLPAVACLGAILLAPRLAAQLAPADYPPLNAKAAAELDRSWTRYRKRAPDSGSRDLYNFFLNAMACNWRPENWAAVIDLAEELHDVNPDSPTYGNYRWYWRDAHPNDRNAVEFCMQTAGLAWVLYRDRLPGDARAKLAAALALGAKGMLRHKVAVSYTNIFLMRLANCILIGESTGRPDLVQSGRACLDEWFAYTRANGIHEFSSPTYYGVDLDDHGQPAKITLVRDGSAVGAQRLAAVLAGGAPRGRVTAAAWVRATEGLADDAAFAAFRRACVEASRHSTAAVEAARIDIAVPGRSTALKLSVDLRKEQRLAVEGADPAMEHGILNINGRDLGTPCLLTK